MGSQKPWTLTARWIIPVEGPPLPGGTITIVGERIASVEAQGARHADKDFGNAAILPGFVNAHTHLDLSGLRGRMPPLSGFTDWLWTVIRHRRTLSTEHVLADIRVGLAEALSYGTTLLGDISAQGLSWSILAQTSARAVVFYELIGLPRVRARQAYIAASQWLRGHPATETCRPGLSPHAPYSVRSSLFRAAANLARPQETPLAIHLAETRAELELLQHHSGPFKDFLTELGVWDEEGLVEGPREVIELNREVAHALFIHGNYLEPAGVIPPGGTVVYCPRTHAAFGHEVHPFRALMTAGVRIALGTDSLASSPDLDILAEVRFLHRRFPEVPGSVLLRMATLSGAEALGWHHETGSLASGKSADLVVLPLPPEDRADPYELILDSSLPIRAVLVRGEWHERPS